jgi:hypothetical protein
MTGPEIPVAITDRLFNAGRQHDRLSVAGQRRAQNEPATERHEAKSDFEQCQTTKGKMLGDDGDDGTRFNYVVKLGNYEGTSSLQTFLAKFKDLASYYRWNERDRVFHLRECLDGAAGQILWDANENTSFEQIIRLLRSRFGNEHQAEGKRAELRSRRRKRGEKLKDVYTDICRLMSLAYPGPTSETSEIVARDAFLDTLGDRSLRVRILEHEPSNLDDALRTALRLEANDKAGLDETGDKRGKNRIKNVRAVAGSHSLSSCAEPTSDEEFY